MTHYDLAIIGSGSGNSLPDERFDGKKIAILEEGTFGGTCLNVGCIPTKMFVYAAALEDGMTPGTVRFDMPVTIQNWRPRNYGGEYRGAVTLSEAMAESLNTVAAQVGYEIGIPKVTALAQRFGIKSPLHNYPSKIGRAHV